MSMAKTLASVPPSPFATLFSVARFDTGLQPSANRNWINAKTNLKKVIQFAVPSLLSDRGCNDWSLRPHKISHGLCVGGLLGREGIATVGSEKRQLRTVIKLTNRKL